MLGGKSSIPIVEAKQNKEKAKHTEKIYMGYVDSEKSRRSEYDSRAKGMQFTRRLSEEEMRVFARPSLREQYARAVGHTVCEHTAACSTSAVIRGRARQGLRIRGLRTCVDGVEAVSGMVEGLQIRQGQFVQMHARADHIDDATPIRHLRQQQVGRGIEAQQVGR